MCYFIGTRRCLSFILDYIGFFISCMGPLVHWLPMLFHRHLGVLLKLPKLFHRQEKGFFLSCPCFFDRHFGFCPRLLKLFNMFEFFFNY
jgi:hypothetical protein